MVRREKAQISSLVYVVIAIVLMFFHMDLAEHSLCAGCGLFDRFAFQFLHVNWFHCIVNCWCILCVVFLYNVYPWMLIASMIIPAIFPDGLINLLSIAPTVGGSGIFYCLVGLCSINAVKKLRYHLWWAFFIAIGLLFSNMNVFLHLWCYVLGWMLAFVNSYLACRR